MFSKSETLETISTVALRQHEKRFIEKTADTLTKDDVVTLWKLYHEQRSAIAKELKEKYRGQPVTPDFAQFNKETNQLAFERVRSTLVPNVTKSELWSLFHKLIIPKKGRESTTNSNINGSIIKRTKRYFKIDDEMIALLEKQLKDLRPGETIEIEFTTQAYARLALKLMPRVTAQLSWSRAYNAKILRKKTLVVELTK